MNLFTISMIFALITCYSAFPTDNEGEMERGRADRQRRVTCDLLSFLGDAACAANCLSMGKSGGTCSSGICYCKQESFSDVWDRRMAYTAKPPGESPQEFLDRYNSRH